MPAASKLGHHGTNINMIASRSGDDTNSILRGNHQEQRIRIKQVPKFMRNAGDLIIKRRSIRRGNNDVEPLDAMERAEPSR